MGSSACFKLDKGFVFCGCLPIDVAGFYMVFPCINLPVRQFNTGFLFVQTLEALTRAGIGTIRLKPTDSHEGRNILDT